MYELLDEKNSERDVRISMAGDWGSGTAEAESVALCMAKFDPHFTIHLGDVYYVGDRQAINENCLGIKNPANNYDPVTWPIGSRGSFALNGNHEMYANGTGYFDVLLPALGLRDSAGKMQGQQTSFFCLQNQYWRILAIDTGYNSVGVPVLSHIPFLNRIPGLRADCTLQPELIDWLKKIVQPDDKRGLVILSHHQNYSAFESQYKKPAKQMYDAGVRRNALWFYGHEHRLAGYELNGTCGLRSYGRCIGHGGMPILLKQPGALPDPVFYDYRKTTNGYGVNGFVNLTFTDKVLRAEYLDLDGTTILRESWVALANGDVLLLTQNKVITDPNFHVE